MSSIEIKALTQAAEMRALLTDLLIETVAAGGSVSFMHPLSRETAGAFWTKSLAAAARGERAVLGAWDGEVLVGTVTLLLDCPPNQPHRAEIAKLMTRVEHRGKGVATRLMRAAAWRRAERFRHQRQVHEGTRVEPSARQRGTLRAGPQDDGRQGT
ncbi:hypothetical protein MESS2_630005 [Mesorhizobium metallidurans STM 2683]|uniref:N-acetyltransferase domain-containing protein n=1 Tax=Mesorhizobium metallidurans STM 2683 TaxID=1297569 RepID=M5EUJ1_9HYPH|nr:GNAT family N-acetyltransferase [Mesorhizobium metallidurans]CCV07700.1 hypothetical protein MESS2_630005 [Mesorhizobium metallidurans STM 2683]